MFVYEICNIYVLPYETGSYVTHETNHFIYFYLDQKAVLLFKSGWLMMWKNLFEADGY